MTTVFLHVGHGKTGSSYAQSSLALCRDHLASPGLAYPTVGTFWARTDPCFSQARPIPNHAASIPLLAHTAWPA